MNKAVFLDRDGVINEDTVYLHEKKFLKFYPESIKALSELSDTDYKIIVVTNQSGIGRGLYTEEEYNAFKKEYIDELAGASDGRIRIDGIYYCPHHSTEGVGKYRIKCKCRKPEPGMLLQAQQDYNISLPESYMIGDKRSDIAAGKAAGCKTILVKTGYAGKGGEGLNVEPDFIFENLYDAVLYVKAEIDNVF